MVARFADAVPSVRGDQPTKRRDRFRGGWHHISSFRRPTSGLYGFLRVAPSPDDATAVARLRRALPCHSGSRLQASHGVTQSPSSRRWGGATPPRADATAVARAAAGLEQGALRAVHRNSGLAASEGHASGRCHSGSTARATAVALLGGVSPSAPLAAVSTVGAVATRIRPLPPSPMFAAVPSSVELTGRRPSEGLLCGRDGCRAAAGRGRLPRAVGPSMEGLSVVCPHGTRRRIRRARRPPLTSSLAEQLSMARHLGAVCRTGLGVDPPPLGSGL